MITWGQLQKSQIDPEKIEEAIARLIAEHNADPEAHLVEGGSLKSHKMAEIIDHLVNSIVADKIRAGEVTREKILNYHSWKLPFESIDGYSMYLPGNAHIEPQIQALVFYNSEVLNDVARLWVGEVYNIIPAIIKNPCIQFSMRIKEPTFTYVYVVWGSNDPIGQPYVNYFGFKTKHDQPQKVFGCYRISPTQAIEVEIPNVLPYEPHFYRAEVLNQGSILRFYVDNNLKAEVSPQWDLWDTDYLFSISLKTFINDSVPHYFWNFTIEQDT